MTQRGQKPTPEKKSLSAETIAEKTSRKDDVPLLPTKSVLRWRPSQEMIEKAVGDVFSPKGSE